MVTAVASLAWFARESPWLIDASANYPPAIFGAGGLLAWRFRRSRAVGAIAALALVRWLGTAANPALLATLVPLSLAALTSTKDRGALATRGLAQVVGTLAAVSLMVGIPVVLPALAAGVEAWDFLPGVGGTVPGGAFSDTSILAAALSGVVIVGFAWFRDDPVDRGMAWSLVSLLMALAVANDPVASSVHLMGAGLVLAMAVVEKSYAMAYHDELTGLPARRALWQDLEAAGTTYTVAMVDIDYFKKFNDRHGHDVGDQVLMMVASQLATVSGGGRAFRYGGEEFTVLFPGKSRKEAMPYLEELRAKVEESRFSVRRRGRPRKKPSGAKTARARKPAGKLQVTVSIGVAERTNTQSTPQRVVKSADRALYRAKRDGRNRVSK
ncbi:MAG: GGDEF domain-containing protein [Gemmatimonadota bacterium]|nr:MAG: GGDEF domain-containing protein [Gemmatimonadota bacterium]